jgi:transposase-like protein
MTKAKFKHPSPNCPNCGSANTHRSMRKGPQEWVLHSLLFQSPYRCEACDHRFFGFRVTAQPKPDPNERPV